MVEDIVRISYMWFDYSRLGALIILICGLNLFLLDTITINSELFAKYMH